ncbi:hypothetical protein [Pseudobacteriovorax antillogorgiicola]|uniref:Uncharacterized protein n=1 Tax=Pseudobacteriovorax antillogorgiicola TaxID=1513793 RepID=A0A1Y6BVG2_9BACT|nr:hypothetical protein [Pseudobacteriovorax antillogorgiicola]TCS53703.1 hypothetical protein EDD56_10712 [Pseudobacteriovorax antillogorgiicola]SMF23001.1 hypothetical protein SAMN06296036_107260 [Pseudobacteriovorax antillogorgiicola]
MSALILIRLTSVALVAILAFYTYTTSRNRKIANEIAEEKNRIAKEALEIKKEALEIKKEALEIKKEAEKTQREKKETP